MIDIRQMTAEELWIETQVALDSIEPDQRFRIIIGRWEDLIAPYYQMFMEGIDG